MNNTTAAAAEAEARATMRAISDLRAAYDLALASGSGTQLDDAMRAIDEAPAGVSVRSGWQSLGDALEPAEFRLEMSGGGPACRIVGSLDQHGAPYAVEIQGQDWFTPWATLPLDAADRADLDWFASFFEFVIS
jgi:hypothetical protein